MDDVQAEVESRDFRAVAFVQLIPGPIRVDGISIEDPVVDDHAGKGLHVRVLDGQNDLIEQAVDVPFHLFEQQGVSQGRISSAHDPEGVFIEDQ